MNTWSVFYKHARNVFQSNDKPCEDRFKTLARYDYRGPIEEDKVVLCLII
jgi:hypothetical protein